MPEADQTASNRMTSSSSDFSTVFSSYDTTSLLSEGEKGTDQPLSSTSDVYTDDTTSSLIESGRVSGGIAAAAIVIVVLVVIILTGIAVSVAILFVIRWRK